MGKRTNMQNRKCAKTKMGMVANLKKQKGAAEKKIQYQKAERVKRKNQ